MPIDFAKARRAMAQQASEAPVDEPAAAATPERVESPAVGWEESVRALAAAHRKSVTNEAQQRAALVDAIRAASAAGVSLRAIAKVAGISFQRVSQILKG